MDIDAFVSLLHDDVVLTMPPSPTWTRGKVATSAFYANHAFVVLRDRPLAFLPVGANGQPLPSPSTSPGSCARSMWCASGRDASSRRTTSWDATVLLHSVCRRRCRPGKDRLCQSTSSSLSNKVAVVVGGSRGLGRGVVEALASRGVRVIAVARDERTLSRTAREVAGVVGVAGDFTDDSLAERVLKQEGPTSSC